MVQLLIIRIFLFLLIWPCLHWLQFDRILIYLDLLLNQVIFTLFYDDILWVGIISTSIYNLGVLIHRIQILGNDICTLINGVVCIVYKSGVVGLTCHWFALIWWPYIGITLLWKKDVLLARFHAVLDGDGGVLFDGLVAIGFVDVVITTLSVFMQVGEGLVR